MSNIENIEDLVGEQIGGVCFVMDYVEICFNGPILRCLSDPLIELPGGSFQFPAAGSRDALCHLIGATVREIRIDKGSSMTLETNNGDILTVPLGDGSRWGSETMHFVPKLDGPIQVW